MSDEIIKLICDIGQSITLDFDGGTEEIKGIIQPLRYKNKLFLSGTFGSAGLNEQSSYLYLGIPSNDLAGKEEVVIYAIGKKLLPVKTDVMYFSDTPLYEWAILKEYQEDETDDD